MPEEKTSPVYKFIKWLVRVFYPCTSVEGIENLPFDPCIVVGNHAQMNGPIACELYFPGWHYTWCAGEMAEMRSVPAYAYRDFWSQKPKCVRWFYKLLSYVIAPLSVCVFNNANVIHVHRDMRIISTFKTSVEHLENGANVIIFPEQDTPHNNIVNGFQDKFVDTARYYYKKTSQEISFVPMYVASALRKIIIGKPIPFRAGVPIKDERSRVCRELQDSITSLALAQPCHTVVPYRNVPKKLYPVSIPKEVKDNETARS